MYWMDLTTTKILLTDDRYHGRYKEILIVALPMGRQHCCHWKNIVFSVRYLNIPTPVTDFD